MTIRSPTLAPTCSLSPLTAKDVFIAALAAGRAVPEDETHVAFANSLLEQIHNKGLRLTPAMRLDDFQSHGEALAAAILSLRPMRQLPAPSPAVQASENADLGALWRACLESAAQRVAAMDPANFTPASCANALRALAGTSALAQPSGAGLHEESR
ncbi:MAG: hypothetical protein E2591_26705 [Achromobacter sp.]|nr:hypothetical protein [Achromobacter sp.]